VKHRQFQGSAILLLACLLSPLFVYGTQLEPYSDAADKEFILPDLKGKTHSLSDYRGKVVLLNFWASWCQPCVQEMPDLTQLKKQLADQPFEILALNAGESKYKVGMFAKRINFNLPVLLDPSSKVFNNWDIKILPTSFLIDANGHVRYRIPGDPGWNDEQTISAIKKLIKETTKPD
jgi:peroxiredoxin